MPLRVLIPGGSGQIGTVIARAFNGRGDRVTVLSRDPAARKAHVQSGHKVPWRVLPWDGRTLGPWADELAECDVVINLAGRSVNCRYTKENMRQMMDSRVDSTRVLGQAIAKSPRPPRVWLQASTATIYSHRFDAANDEPTGQIGGSEPGVPAYWKFSIDIAQAWERELAAANTPHTRKVALRSAMTMSHDTGGVFDTLLGLVRKGLGGPNGNGKQFVSWVHEKDFLAALDWLIKREDFTGPVNICSPNPLPNSEFMRDLRHAWLECGTSGRMGARIGLPAFKWMLEIGAVFLKTDTELILKSRRVVPTRLLESGFRFEFPDWPIAARHLCKKWISARAITPITPQADQQ